MQLLGKWTFIFAIVISCGLLVQEYGVALSVVNGTSMQPTLQDGDQLVINKLRFLIDSPKIGDVITFKDPSQTHRFLVKRVIGVSGDTIEIRKGILYRNGRKVTEPYINSRIEDGDFGPVIVRENTVFVMGDNRHRWASRDSRYPSVGLVPYELIDGKVELILWRPSLSAFL
ncbi:signal peptidase I [Thermoflavimicrobium dichotomicum]|uniref:Signal peptidase I n=1 Tax=Thermoflavimicrobium dichotomicum TaxID=46223 RepID=A0A1I3JEI5_9BACL|nr:signal peptidase I [Thermoflavimicrobium dichotomicum]SFI58556.1 signal peptidase I [Thermoflavimicrobium dichotomicum]